MYNQAKTGVATPRTTTAGPGESSISGAAASLSSAVKDLSEQANRARGIADNIFGGAPPETGNPDTVPAPGTLGSLNFEMSCLYTVIADLRQQLDRLSCL